MTFGQACSLTLVLGTTFPPMGQASENLPQLPFGQAAFLPEEHAFVLTPWYEYARFQHFWRKKEDVSLEIQNTDDYEINNGVLRFEYGLAPAWALDMTMGFTTGSSRDFKPSHMPNTTLGLMDTQFGLRWQAWHEAKTDRWFVPTVALRAGGIAAGSYGADFPFAPGKGGSGFEPSVIMSKTFGESGLGLFGDFGWRIRGSHVPPTLFGSAGVSQSFRFRAFVDSFTLNAGYHGSTDLSGPDLTGGLFNLNYSRRVREMNQQWEVGFLLTDRWGRRFGFYFDYTFDGRNTGQKVVYGLYASLPLGGKP